MARTVDQAFDVFLKRLTPTAAQRDAGASHRASVKAALEARLEVSRFLETGSFSHGTGVRNNSDIDLLVSLKGDPSTPVRIRRPAVAVEFGGGYETWEIIPGYITGRGGRALVYDVPSPRVGGAWIDSAPDEHLTYVNEANKKPDKGDAKALARLMKAWKYYRNVPVSSFYLEMQAARYVRGIKTYIHVWDLCLLLERLHGNKLAAMNDPSNASGRIRACSSDSTRADALSKLQRAASRARKALNAYKGSDEGDAFYYLDLLFNGKFPSRY